MTTYGETVDVHQYITQLQVHQYIPQSDAVIVELIQSFTHLHSSLLDVGMGPARLTPILSTLKNMDYIGLDISVPFVEYSRALSLRAQFVCEDFLDFGGTADIILMQGVWHHVPVGYRPTWLSKLRAVLQSGGRLILSDEFVAPYKSEVQRRQHVVLFYLHVIGEAVKAGCEGLVFDESLNLLADVLYDYPHMRGVYNKELLDYIRSTAVEVNARLSPLSTSPLTIGEAVELSQDIVMRLLYLSVGLAKQDGQGRIDRGDYKTSVEAAVSEFTNVGWRCDLIRKIGPVDELGGMAVLVFR